MNEWLLLLVVAGALFAFWLWLGRVFDAINEWHAAARREDSSPDGERGA